MAQVQRPTRERTRKVPVAMPEEPRAAAWLRNFRLSGFALSMLLLVVAALVVLAPGLKTFVEQRQQIAALEESVALAQAEVDDLEAEIDRWSDPAYIEAQARDRLYYVYPGDITFLVIGDDDTGLNEGGLPISDEIQTTQVDWVRALLSTVYQAGLTDATPEQLESPQQGG
ncbi:septum formation initiator family protein [Pseudolysinimonas sp.]|uniref:FtsB family cell division protein n=1 Tax=Pseudolysinimonas sp. TaxID=2680009 RepID=UPI00286CA527|nr:septum formation initiator family protein [Pseudolysinimonas sp.]